MSTPPCCPPGSWPQLLLTTSNADLNQEEVPAPKGTLTSIPVEGQEDLPLYVVEPKFGDAMGGILVIPDIYSVRVLLPEVRSADRIGSICDALAEQGYVVALAGVFRDQPYDKAVVAPDDGDFLKFDAFAPDGGVAWIASNSYSKIGPCVQAATNFLKSKVPDKKIGALGYCFGTWSFCKASAIGDVKLDCAVGCHPTTILEKAVFGGDEDAMMASLPQPTAILWAGNDDASYTKGGSNAKAVEATGGMVEEYPDMLHGWVSRGDVADPAVKAGVEKALATIEGFFEKHLKN